LGAPDDPPPELPGAAAAPPGVSACRGVGLAPIQFRGRAGTFAFIGLVYTRPMSRAVHITITDGQHMWLSGESVRTGLSMAELVRRAFDATYRPDGRPVVGGFHVNVGVTRRPDAAVIARLRAPPRQALD